MESSIVAVFAAFIAAAGAVFIGLLHLAMMEQQNRIAAFEKRFAVFEGLDVAIYEICKHNKPSVEGLMAFNRSMRQVYFLFPQSLHDRLSDVRKQSVVMVGMYHELWDESGNPREGYSNEKLDKYHSAQLKIIQTWEKLSELLRPHMALSKR